jgi:deoxyuridine 5'-triphosphate nucleotidohydrolase
VYRKDPTAALPTRGTPGAAAFDLRLPGSYVTWLNDNGHLSTETEEGEHKGKHYFTIDAGSVVILPTGLCFDLPDRTWWIDVRGRSGLAFKKDVMPFHGLIDCDFQGEVKLHLMNHSAKTQKIYVEDAVAQLLFMPRYVDRLVELSAQQWAEKLRREQESNKRGVNGFGHSDAKAKTR